MITPAADNLPTVGQRGDEVQAFDCVDTVEQLELSAWQELSKKLKTFLLAFDLNHARLGGGSREHATGYQNILFVTKSFSFK